MSNCGWKMVEIEGRGRGVVASQPLKGGQIILTDSPILLYSAHPLSSCSSSSSSSAYCSNCFRHLKQACSTITACSSCPSLFCSPDCLTHALSSSHSPWACSALTLLRASPSLSSSPPDRQLQARFLVAAYNLAVVSPLHFGILLSLQGTPDYLPPSDSDAPAFLHSLISSLSPPPLPQGAFGFSLDLTAALLAKDQLNAFGLMEPPGGHRSVRAYGIYPNASLFNHDCLPNACRFDYVDTASRPHNSDITIRLIHDVPEGREICLSYFPVNETFGDRQKRLLEDYGFTCNCDRCRVEANWKDEDGDEDEIEVEVEDEERDEPMVVSENENEIAGDGGDNDFPHAYFFLRYMCNRDNCWGTLAPLPPSDSEASPSNLMECNVCGNLNKADEDEDFNSNQDRLSVDD